MSDAVMIAYIVSGTVLLLAAIVGWVYLLAHSEPPEVRWPDLPEIPMWTSTRRVPSDAAHATVSDETGAVGQTGAGDEERGAEA